jgi:hypothetical protein
MIDAEAFRHRLHRFARPVGEQPTHVQLAFEPLIRTPDSTVKHSRSEFDQPWTHPARSAPELHREVN